MKKLYILSVVLFAISNTAFSQYLGEIKLMSAAFAPKGWAKCEGQLLPINQNQALFSILGTTYGGDGRTTFALPDLRGKVVVGMGNSMVLGQTGGTESVTITANNIPAHSHYEPIKISTSQATQSIPNGSSSFAAPALIVNNVPRTALGYTTATPDVTLASTPTTTNGGVQSPVAITNIQPYTALVYMIAIQGVFPSQN